VGGSLQELVKANPYVYADNNPVNETDVSGRCSDFARIAAFAALAAAFLVLAPLLAGLGPADYIAIYLILTESDTGILASLGLVAGIGTFLDCLTS
jgi:hypothetical protein